MASKVGAVGDNGGMTCGAKVSRGVVEYSGGMEVSSIERPVAQPHGQQPTCSPALLG